MNKKELSDLKKNFDDKNGFFTFNRILRAFVTSEKEVIFKNHSLLGTLPSEEQELIQVTLRKALSGTLGKNLCEYSFPESQYEEDGAQHILYNILKSKFENDEHTSAFLDNITKNIEYASTFATISAHCTYTLFRRDKNDEKTEDSNDYNFILTVICPVEIGEDVLIFDDNANNICLIPEKSRVISRNPTDGFLFPVLTCGDPDINSVLTYTSKPKEPNRSVIKDILGCEISFTAAGEKEVFGKVLHDVIGKDLDYTIITTINDRIAEEVKEHRFDSKPATIDDIKLKNILSDSGIEDEKLEKVHKAFTEAVGKKPLTASNLVASKTVVVTPDITVNISKNATEKVRTSLIGGRKCLVIDLDDPNIIINGLPTTIELSSSVTAKSNLSQAEAETAAPSATEAVGNGSDSDDDYDAF